jgi:N-acetyl-1-D-myo-inositol-2-amino-2-deoxy-alpha-D-glucopyranoside deacetylase
MAAVNGMLPYSAQTRLLVVAPHPDDETIATGLLIQQVLAAGGEVCVLLLTAGDNNPWPQRWIERRVRIGREDRQRWGRRRMGELGQAMQCLGLPPEALQAMNWPDMGLTDLLLHPGDGATAAMAAVINRWAPTLIAMPALGDCHPDHGAAHVLVRLALARLDRTISTMAYLVHGRTKRVSNSQITPLSGQLKVKLQALTAHRSQMALSAKRMRRMAERPEHYEVVPTTATSVDLALPWRPPLALRPWLRLIVIDRSGARSWRWYDAPIRRDGRGAFYFAGAVEADAASRFAKLAWDLPVPWVFDHWGWCVL